MNDNEAAAYIRLKACSHRLTPEQYKTLRGQILAGDVAEAMKGLRTLIHRNRDT